MNQCKHCKKQLKGQRTQFCDDTCSYEYNSMIVSNQRKQERLEQEDRYCKYELCKALLPKGISKLKKYCKDTKCATNQNQLEAKRKRDEEKARAGDKSETRVCICGCGQIFKVKSKYSKKRYFNKTCNNRMREVREKNKRENITHKEEKSSINPKYMHRNYSGIPGSTQVATMMGEA